MKIFIRWIGLVVITIIKLNIIHGQSVHIFKKKDEKKITAELKAIDRKLEIAYSKENSNSILTFYNEVFINLAHNTGKIHFYGTMITSFTSLSVSKHGGFNPGHIFALFIVA